MDPFRAPDGSWLPDPAGANLNLGGRGRRNVIAWTERVRYRRDHRWARRHVHAYLDGELVAHDRRRLARHAVMCPECGPMLASLVRLLWALRLLRVTPRPSVAPAILVRWRAEPKFGVPSPPGRSR
jgi:anti-sigma factor RsiW